MEEYKKIKEFLLDLDFSLVGGVSNLFDILEDKRILENLIISYGDDLSVSSSPEFALFREKYVRICC